jgi:hypothetical protein
MTASRDDIAGRPWHLIPQEVRERSAIANCEVDADGGCDCGGPFGMLPAPCQGDCRIRAEAFAAAAQVLRDAAPYPDEALVFEVIEFVSPFKRGEHLECTGLDGEGFPVVLWRCPEGRIYPCSIGWIKLLPLTIAANDLWTEAQR